MSKALYWFEQALRAFTGPHIFSRVDVLWPEGFERPDGGILDDLVYDFWPAQEFEERAAFLKNGFMKGRYIYWSSNKGWLQTAQMLGENQNDTKKLAALWALAALHDLCGHGRGRRDFPEHWRPVRDLCDDAHREAHSFAGLEGPAWHHLVSSTLPAALNINLLVAPRYERDLADHVRSCVALNLAEHRLVEVRRCSGGEA